MKPYFLPFLLALVLSAGVSADTIVLKNGLHLEADRIWEEAAEIKCALHGVVIGFDSDKVLRVERRQPPPQSGTDTNRGAAASSEAQSDEISRRTETLPPRSGPGDLIQKQTEDLALEYRRLLQALAELQAEGDNALTAAAIEAYNQKTLRLNRQIARYEEKRNALQQRTRAVASAGIISEDYFLNRMRSWIGHGIQEFIDQWGTADDAFSSGTDRRTYLFVITISPSYSRRIYFETGSNGIILNSKPDEWFQSPLDLNVNP